MAGSDGNRNVDRQSDRPEPQAAKGGPKAKSPLPMTAMIDVTFLLLTYFLLTTTFRQAEGQLPASLPGPDPGLSRPILVNVRAVGADCESAVYTVDGSGEMLRSPRQLLDSIEAQTELRGRNHPLVVIQAGRAVRWRYVVEACNQAAKANCPSTIRI